MTVLQVALLVTGLATVVLLALGAIFGDRADRRGDRNDVLCGVFLSGGAGACFAFGVLLTAFL